MPSLFEVDVKSIELLDQLKLTELLKRLLHLEASANGIADRAIEVALNITVPDGGEDGRIQWSDGPVSTEYLPSRFVQFQSKATKMGPADCANELLDRRGNLKQMVADALENGATYIIFNNYNLTKPLKDKRVASIQAQLKKLGKPYAHSAEVYVYDASMIQSWVNKYISAVAAVAHWVHRPIIHGMQVWEEWNKRNEFQRFTFVPDDDRRRAVADIRSLLVGPRTAARIIGLSGLGKTRLALEAFRASDSAKDISKEVVYIDAAYDVPHLAATVSEWVRHRYRGILAVDNCDLALHKRLKTEILRTDSHLSLLTMDYTLETDDTRTVKLEPMDDAFIKDMLEPVYKKTISDLHRIVSFAQGFPQMAVLLADARLNDSAQMGSLTDDDLLRKMLWGSAPQNENAYKTILAYSLFESFGFDGEVSDEFAYIAEQIVELGVDECHRHFTTFRNRGIIDTRGRYGQVIPMPLAVRLASDWWKTTRRTRAVSLISAPLPGRLAEALCERVTKLDFLPEIKQLTKELCGEQGPFGQAEVILSERGSRLFRSFVETNPAAAAEALERVLRPQSKTELRLVDGDVRRNLVWALEKLCFRKETFPIAARLLLQLAAAETENWSNNASGLFVQMFNTFLSGTEAPPALRLEIADEALTTADIDVHRIAVDALGRAVETTHFLRTGGAEEQGSGRPLQDWRPQTWGEAFAYWETALQKLTNLVEQNGEIGELAKSKIAGSIRGLIQHGRVAALDKAIRTIVQQRGPFWPNALGNIQTVLNYDSEKMPSEGKKKLEEWQALLQPTDLRERIRLIVSIPPYEHEQDERGQHVDLAAEKAKRFASECVADLPNFLKNFDVLLSGEQRQGYVFGRALGEQAHNIADIIDAGLRVLENLPSDTRNSIVLSAMLNELKATNHIASQNVLRRVATTDTLVDQFPDFLRLYSPDRNDLNIFVNLIESGKLSVASARVFSYGRALDHISGSDLNDFALKLAQFRPDGPWVSLDITFMYCYGGKGRWNEAKETFKTLVGLVPLSKPKGPAHHDFHQWQQTVQKLFQTEGDQQLAKTIAGQIIAAVRNDISYGDIENSVKPVLYTLLTKHPTIVWPLFSEDIKQANPLHRETLRSVLGGFGDQERESAAILALPEGYLMSWCRDNPTVGPKFVASVIPVVVNGDGKWGLSELAQTLLNEFGDDPDVLRALSVSMGSFSWSGSLVPFYQRQQEALATVKQHPNQNVRQWVKKHLIYLEEQIKRESQSDEEHRWGIY